MSVISKLFKKPSVKDKTLPIECATLFEFQAQLESLLAKCDYIAKREYLPFFQKYSDAIQMFKTQKNMGTLDLYCKRNGLETHEIEKTISNFEMLENIVDRRNENFIQNELTAQKDYLDKILFEIDKNILLDENQRRVVLSDEDYTLVIAGAGAGKTTTVAAKVKYLVKKKNIDPSEILIISFTNKAVGELRERINHDLKIPCPISTFHATGNAILRKQSTEKLNIVREGKLYFILQDYFRDSVLNNEMMIKKLVLFFASYFDFPYSGKKLEDYFAYIANANFSTLKSELNEFEKEIFDNSKKRKITIQEERVASLEEVEIANFLYMNNIEYQYEPIYPYLFPQSHRPYTPDFLITQNGKEIYIEHFGLTEKGENDRFAPEQLEKYKRQVHQKVAFHREHGTELIFTFSEYNDGRSHIEHLKEKLVQHGVELCERDSKEVMQKIIATEGNKYIAKIVNLLQRFIENFKTNGYNASDFQRFKTQTKSPRTQLFLDIAEICYLEYEQYLKEHNQIDFSDMINKSAKMLSEFREKGLGAIKDLPNFKYIIIDEYQDISRQRFNLAKALSDFTKAKIIAVGDDWQSIYAFSGSDITLFTKFAQSVGYAKQLTIDYTYRNSQEVIDIAGDFIQKNQAQIKKQLKSPKTIKDPVIIYTYDSHKKDKKTGLKNGDINSCAQTIETILEQIIEYNRIEGKSENSSVLLLGRFNFDGKNLERSGKFTYYNTRDENNIKSNKFPKMNITFMTAHSSKGLGRDNIIVINGKNGTYGFPSKIENDPVLRLVTQHDDAIEYAEERRLFYVAMTRTKNRVFFIAPQDRPSEFLLELRRNHTNIKLCGNWDENSINVETFKKRCPICGYPLVLKHNPTFGLPLFICSNDPEVCEFMTNKIEGEKLSVMKCPDCTDGFLIVKTPDMLGCTNYLKGGNGCNKRISKQMYYKMMGYKLP